MRSVLTILLASTIWCGAVVPPIQSVTLAWDYPTNKVQGTVFRIYDIIGPLTNQVAIVTNELRVTIPNVLTTPHRWTVTASNEVGESDMSLPYERPGGSAVPSQLKPISTTLLNVPVPGIIESTTDLANWRTRYRLAIHTNGINFTQIIIPSEVMEFMRAKSFTAQVPPPLP